MGTSVSPSLSVLSELERCNRDNVDALQEIVGGGGGGGGGGGAGDAAGPGEQTETSRSLKDAGNAWAQHVLEGPRAWIMSAVYIAITVTLGYPLVSGVAAACGVTVVWVGRCRLTLSNPR